MPFQNSWIAIVVTAGIGMLVPALWYAPKVFGNAWLELSGLKASDSKGAGPTMALAAFCSLLTAFALAGFMSYFGSQTFVQGFLAGAELWLAFVATSLVTDYRFAKRPWKLAMINLGHSLLSLGLMGGVLAVWK